MNITGVFDGALFENAPLRGLLTNANVVDYGGLLTILRGCIDIRINKYSFIRCFEHDADRQIVIEEMARYIRDHYSGIDAPMYISSGKMYIDDWLMILSACCSRFKCRYRLCRNAYYGEHSGWESGPGSTPRAVKSLHCILRVYGPANGPVYNLLVESKESRVCCMSNQKMKLSNWTNHKVGLDAWNKRVE